MCDVCLRLVPPKGRQHARLAAFLGDTRLSRRLNMQFAGGGFLGFFCLVKECCCDLPREAPHQHLEVSGFWFLVLVGSADV